MLKKSTLVLLLISTTSFTLSFGQGSPNYSSWQLENSTWNVASVFVHTSSPFSLPPNWSNCSKNNGGELTTHQWNYPPPLAITLACGRMDTSFIVKAFDIKTPTWHYYYMSALSDTNAFVHMFDYRDTSYRHYNQFKDYSTGQWIDLKDHDTIALSAFIPSANRNTDLNGYQTLVYVRVRGKDIPKGQQKKSSSEDNSETFTSIDQYQTSMRLNDDVNGNYEVYNANGQLLFTGAFNNGSINFNNNGFNSRMLIVVIRPVGQEPVVEKVVVP